MEVTTRHSRLASLLMLGLLLCTPLIQPSAAGLFPSPAVKECCGSCARDAPPLVLAENNVGPDHADGAQTTQSGQTECDVCPSSARCPSAASILLPHMHGPVPVMAQTTHFAPYAGDPVTPLHDGGLFRPPRPGSARAG
jgi:hypothetical protein